MLLRPFEKLARWAIGRRGIESRMVETRAGVHHVYDAHGKGALPPIVLLHGIGATATGFGPLMFGLLPHTRRVLAPEAPGHGFSGRPRVRLDPPTLFGAMRELLDRELREPAIVFGNSLGGAVALDYTRASPKNVRGLVLCSPAGARMERDEMTRFLKTFELQSRGDAHRFLRSLYHRPPWYLGLLASDVRAIFASQPIRDILSSASPEDAVPEEALKKLETPLAFVWGRSEKVMPRAHFEWYRRHLPESAEIVEPDEFGHCPHLDRPRDVARIIVEFAKRVALSADVGHSGTS
jgi:pimeloyl-ACP methyl ester carboxylesterase